MKYILILSLLFTYSCLHNYTSKDNKSNNYRSMKVPPPEPVEAEKDPFLKSPYNSPNYGGFSASKFDTWLFRVSFSSNKLPMYKFFDDSKRKWTTPSRDWKNNIASSYKANDDENKIYSSPESSISNVTIYKYDRNNPLYNINGYLKGRMDRFKFYAIDGKAGFDIKQYLIAVDTYSKFVFAFATVTSIGTSGRNTYPKDFKAIEFSADKLHFYEYDPIGYVTQNGDIVFYKHYEEEFIKNPNAYYPKQHEYDKVAERTSSGEGYSPYKPIITDGEASNEEKNAFYKEMQKIANKELYWRDYSGYQKNNIIDADKWVKEGYSGRSLILYKYNISSNAQIINLTKENYNHNNKEDIEYRISIITSDKNAKYVNTKNNQDIINVELQNNKTNAISINDNTLTTVDNGPLFVDRMINKRFTKDSINLSPGSSFLPDTSGTVFGGTINNLTYQFNNNGTKYKMSFIYKNQRYEYNFKLVRFDSNPAYNWTSKFESINVSGTLGKYTRVVLRNNGNTIRSSLTLQSINSAESPQSDAGLEMIADLQK